MKAIIIGVLAVGLLAGCTSTSDSSVPIAYLAVAHRVVPNDSNREAISTGKQICQSLAQGVPPAGPVALVSAAVTAFCPT